MKLYAHTIIKRPISDVFDYLADVENDVNWRDEIIQAEFISKAPLGIGSEGRHKVKQGSGELDVTWKCTRLDSPVNIEWEWTSGIPASAGYKLKTTDEGTDFTFYGTTTDKGITRFISPIIQFVFNRQLQKNAENLKKILESNTP